MYRGKLIEAEDNMNSQMASVTVTYRDGRVAQLENIYIRYPNTLHPVFSTHLKRLKFAKKSKLNFSAGAPRSGS